MQGVRCSKIFQNLKFNFKPIVSRTVIASTQASSRFLNVRYFATNPEPDQKSAATFAKTRSLCKSIGLVGNTTVR
jgi:hypothetical protein